mgnify:CR=1 FL=1
MGGQRILFPYHFTSYDQRALEFVIQTFSHQKDAEITLFTAYTPIPEIEMQRAPVMEKMRGNLSLLSQRIKEQEESLRAVQEILIENGFPREQVRYIFKPRKKDTASEIIDAARKNNSNVVIINNKPGRVKRLFTGTVFHKIVAALKDRTICIVT